MPHEEERLHEGEERHTRDEFHAASALEHVARACLDGEEEAFENL